MITGFVEMKLAAKTDKLDVIKNQLVSLLDVRVSDITFETTNYLGVTLINIADTSHVSVNTIRNVDVELLDDATAAEVCSATKFRDGAFFQSLNFVDQLDQYEYLSVLLHMRRTERDKT